MHLPGKLLSTLAIALLLRCNAMSTATTTETLTPYLRSSIGGRTDENDRSLRALDSTRESSEPEEARLFGRFFSSFLGNTRSSSRSSSIPKPVVLKQPKLDKKRLKNQMKIYRGGVGTKKLKDFDAWLKNLATQPDHLQYQVFKKWSSKDIYPQRLERWLYKADATRTKSVDEMLNKYRIYYDIIPMEKKANKYVST